MPGRTGTSSSAATATTTTTTTMPPPTPSATTVKRIHREIADLKKEDLGPITLAPSEDSLFLWKATLPGPEGSVYEGGVFHVDIALGHDYPFSAPRLTFRTRIYHMNISDRGGICIDILKHNWSPALSLFKVILSLSSLLTDPNPKDPLVPAIATEYVRTREQHDRTARSWTQLYAKPPPVTLFQPSGKSREISLVPVTQPSRVPQPSQIVGGTTIVIEDSDDERPTPGANTRSKRKRGTNDETVDLTTEQASEHRQRRSRRRVGEGAGGSSTREVIVIDD